MEILEIEETCPRCDGTGLYIGIAECDGAAVVCRYCSGTGCYKFKHEYQRFTTRWARPGVKRVYEFNPGICIRESKEKGYRLEDYGGMPYMDWLEGKPFPPKSENRKFTCPALWYGPEGCSNPSAQNLDHFFTDCKYFKDKVDCWLKFDTKQGNNQGGG